MKPRETIESSELAWQQQAPVAPPVSLIATAFNESATIRHSIRSLLDLRYPHVEIVVVNDGSTDETLSILIDEYKLVPSGRPVEGLLQYKPIRQIYRSVKYRNFVVVDKANGGKADALNAGIDVSRSPLFCAFDADSLLDGEALLHATQPFLEKPATLIAVGGAVRPANGCQVVGGRVVRVGLPEKLLPLLQTVEYIRAFLIARIAMSQLGILTLISGAFGVFRRSAAIAVGGYNVATVGEDYDLMMRLHEYYLENEIPYEVASVPDPVCWTEVPESFANLSSQRRRWQRGALQTFFAYRHLMLRPRFGRIGMVSMPMAFLTDVVGPLAEFLGYFLIPLYYVFGVLDVSYLLAFIAVTFVFGIFVSAGALCLEEISLKRNPSAKDLLILAFAIIVENFGYRQINNWWRLRGWFEFATGKKGWGTMTRKGFQSGTP